MTWFINPFQACTDHSSFVTDQPDSQTRLLSTLESFWEAGLARYELSKIPYNERELFCSQVLDMIAQNMDDTEKNSIIEAFARIPVERRGVVSKEAATILKQGIGKISSKRIIGILATVSDGSLEGLGEDFLKLLAHSNSYRGIDPRYSFLLDAFGKISVYQRHEMICYLDRVLKNKVTSNDLFKALNELHASPNFHWEEVERQVARIDDHCGEVISRSGLLAEMLSVSGEHLEEFVSLCISIYRRESHYLGGFQPLVRKMLQVPQKQRVSVAKHAMEICYDHVSSHNRHMIVTRIMKIPEDQREIFVSQWKRLIHPQMNAQEINFVSQALLKVDQQEREQFVNICLPLNRGTRVSMANEIYDVARVRASHRTNLVRQMLGLPYEDNENVMRSERRNATVQSFLRLMPYGFPTLEEFQTEINEIIEWLKNENTEVSSRALEALTRPKQGQSDYARRLVSNPPWNRNKVGLGQLVVFVHRLIRKYVEERSSKPEVDLVLLNDSFINALASCIEDDGHLVCDVGISQRLMTVLQGWYEEVEIDQQKVLTPNQLLSQLCSSHRDLLETDSRQFYTFAMSECMRCYADNEDLQRSFKIDHLDQFFDNQGLPK